MSRKVDGFAERFQKACEAAKMPYQQTRLAVILETTKQHVDSWMNGGLPRADKLFDIADKLKADPRWLATGEEQQQDSLNIPETMAIKVLAAIRKILDTEYQEDAVKAIEALLGGNGNGGRQRTHRRPRR